jgi:hypothetical protein
MGRASWWRAASLILVGGLATRVIWFAWQYYFSGGPRYRVESAMIALVIVGAMLVALRRADLPAGIPPHTSVSRAWLPIFIVAAVALYYHAIGLGLLSDDYSLRAMAQSESLGSGTGWFFRPVPLLLWRGLLAVFDSPAALHLLNIVLHGVNAWLVAVLGGALGMRREVSIGAAALFLTFPVLAEAVVWAAGIQDVLMTTMALGAVVLCARETPDVRRMALVCGLLIVGFGSKETAVCIPVLIALCWLTRERMRRDVKLFGALALVTTAYLAIRLPMGIASDYLGTPTRYFFKQMTVIAFGTLATPWRAPASLAERWLSFAAVAVVVLLVTHAFLTWRRSEPRVQRDVRLALWVLASIAPVFTLFFVGPTLEGARYLYLASCAWSLVIGDLLASVSDRVSQRPAVFGGAVAVIALVFTVSLQREIGIWQQAADLRDRVLADARTVRDTAGCPGATFANVPDSVEGAYVFRNGFPEALADSTRDPADVRPGCSFTWTGGGFAPSR